MNKFFLSLYLFLWAQYPLKTGDVFPSCSHFVEVWKCGRTENVLEMDRHTNVCSLMHATKTDSRTDQLIANQSDRRTDKQTKRQTDKQTDRRTDGQTDRQTDKQSDRQADRQTDKQTDRKTVKQTEGQTLGLTGRRDRQTDIQTFRQNYMENKRDRSSEREKYWQTDDRLAKRKVFAKIDSFNKGQTKS